MKVQIEIECETSGELEKHLEVIRQTVSLRSRGNLDYDFEVGTEFSDNNCYGTHHVTIIPETE